MITNSKDDGQISAHHKYLGLILARGGSKRLPGKNIRRLLGKPMLAWTIEASQACEAIARTVVSTDCKEIAGVANQWGADVPFLRPAEFSADHSTSEDAAIHALDYISETDGLNYDVVVLLEPTSPLRASSDLSHVIKLLEANWNRTDAVVTVGDQKLVSRGVMKWQDDQGFLKSWTELGMVNSEIAVFPFGVAYAIKVSSLRKFRTFYPPRILGYPIARWQHFEVDDDIDFACVEAVLCYFKGQLP